MHFEHEHQLTIREEFPSPDGNYEGFKECACESDISLTSLK
jgi:hypothetical protein